MMQDVRIVSENAFNQLENICSNGYKDCLLRVQLRVGAGQQNRMINSAAAGNLLTAPGEARTGETEDN